jgi:hypothetical protein
VTKVKYSVSSDIILYTVHGSLVDGGANGGVTGADRFILSICENSKVDISCVSDTMILDLTLCQGASVITMASDRKLFQSFTSMPIWERGPPYIPLLNWKTIMV